MRKVSAEGGFTLTEVMVAILILAMIVAAFVPLYAHASEWSALNQARLQAVLFASRRVEQVRSLPFLAVGTEGGNPPSGTSPPIQRSMTEIGPDGRTYTIATEVTWVEEDSSGNFDKPLPYDYKLITVTVTTGPFFNGSREVEETVSSIIAREGHQEMTAGGHVRVRARRLIDIEEKVAYVGFRLTRHGFDQSSRTDQRSGNALFIDLPGGEYQISTTDSRGMMVDPDHPTTVVPPSLGTANVTVLLEHPWHLEVKLHEADFNPPNTAKVDRELTPTDLKLILWWNEKQQPPRIDWENDWRDHFDFSNVTVEQTALGDLWPDATKLFFLEPHVKKGAQSFLLSYKHNDLETKSLDDVGRYPSVGMKLNDKFTIEPNAMHELSVYLVPVCQEVLGSGSDDALSLNWMSGSNILSHGGTSDKTVVWHQSGVARLRTMWMSTSASSATYIAEKMVFENHLEISPRWLPLWHNTSIILDAPVIVFNGSIDLRVRQHSSGNFFGALAFLSADSDRLIPGSEIAGGSSGTSYFRVYFLEDVTVTIMDGSYAPLRTEILLHKGAYYVANGSSLSAAIIAGNPGEKTGDFVER